MKKTIFAIALAVILGLNINLNAQTTHGIQVRLGSSKVQTSDDEWGHTFNSGFAWGIGYQADINISDNFVIQPGILYMNRVGTDVTEFKDESNAYDIKRNVDFNIPSIDLPVYFFYKAGMPGDNFRFYGGLGPVLQFRMGGHENGTVRINNAGTVTNSTIDQDLKYGSAAGEWKSFGFGYNIQIGADIANAIQVAFDYTGDITSVQNPSTPYPFEGKFNVVGLKFAYLINGKADY